VTQGWQNNAARQPMPALPGSLELSQPLSALIFGLALALYLDSGSLEPARFYGDRLWVIAHTSPVYYAVGILQYAVHGLRVTPENVPVNFAALIGWALVAAGGGAWLGLRRAVVT